MYDCKAPLSRFYYPDTRRIINAFIIIIIVRRADGVAQSNVDLRYYVIRDVIVI